MLLSCPFKRQRKENVKINIITTSENCRGREKRSHLRLFVVLSGNLRKCWTKKIHQNFDQNSEWGANFFAYNKAVKISISKSHEMSEVKAEMTNRNCFFSLFGLIVMFWMSLQFSVCHFKARDVSIQSFFSLLSSPMHSIVAFHPSDVYDYFPRPRPKNQWKSHFWQKNLLRAKKLIVFNLEAIFYAFIMQSKSTLSKSRTLWAIWRRYANRQAGRQQHIKAYIKLWQKPFAT